MQVGTKLNLEGRIQSREYQKKLNDEEVVNKTAYEISISKVNIIENEPITSIELNKLKKSVNE